MSGPWSSVINNTGNAAHEATVAQREAKARADAVRGAADALKADLQGGTMSWVQVLDWLHTYADDLER